MSQAGAPGNRRGTSFAQAHKPVSRLVFDKYDTDGSGTISVNEFRNLCYDMGYFLADKELMMAIRLLDSDGNGEISYAEFIKWWQQEHRSRTLQLSQQDLADLTDISADFQRFDKDHSGCIDVREFRLLYADLVKRGMTRKTLAGTLEELDHNRDGKVSFNEYVDWVLTQRRNKEEAENRHERPSQPSRHSEPLQ